LPISLNFSASIPTEIAEQVRLRDSSGRTWSVAPSEGYRSNLTGSVEFKGPFPESAELAVEFPKGFRDDVGRSLEMAAPLKVRTDASPPLAKFHGSFGIIERGEQQLLPLTVRRIEPAVEIQFEKKGAPLPRNLPAKMTRVSSAEEILALLRRVTQVPRGVSMFSGVTPSNVRRLEVPRSGDERALEVIGIPLAEPGFYGVEVESPALGAAYLEGKSPYYVRTAALVTDLAVHLKVGAERSLVWVTHLGSGEPAADAAVTVADCRGKALVGGRTDSRGIFMIPSLPQNMSYDYCNSGPSHFIVLASKGNDLSFTLSSWTEGIEVWRFDLPTGVWGDTFESANTVIAQSLVRRGEIVKMKHILRRRTGDGLRLPAPGAPEIARLTHLGSDEQYDFPLRWRKNGAAESEWKVPPGAKLGTYSVSLIRTKKDGSIDNILSGTFRVEDYRVPLMRAVVKLPDENIVRPESVNLTAAVAYLSGGGAKRLPVTVRYKIAPQGYVSFPGFEGYSFGAGAVETGRVKEEYNPEGGSGGESKLLTTSAVLDDAGTGSIKLDRLTLHEGLSRLSAELEYKDVAGFVQTVSTSAQIWSADTILGIKTGSWISKDAIPVSLSAVSPDGAPRAGVPVTVELYSRQGYSHRKRIVGGFYSYDTSVEITHSGTPCSGVTDEKGVFTCTVRTARSGEFIVEGRAADSAGRLAATKTSLWVSEGGRQWFGGRDDDRIDVLPEKSDYEAGETARFQVRMPFERGTALVTVEREGVIDSFVQPIDSRDPVVSVPLKTGYAPNVYVSVLVVRGRVGGVVPTALVDLGKPAFKLGIARVNVGWKPHEITVSVTPERDVYKVRETARVKVRGVSAVDGSAVANGEVALVAIDEGLLELQPNDSWRLLGRMMGLRPHDVFTATAQMHIVGRRHFGLKARPDGGGGGRGLTRELFDALLYWNPRVMLDKNGEASVEIPLNDSLTSFRIAAIAAAGQSLFGTGSAAIRATQDLIVVPGFAPVARHEDSVVNTVSLRNTTAAPMPIEISLQSDHPAVQGAPEKRVLESGGSAEIGWRIAIPEGIEGLTYTLEARSGEKIIDRVKIPQKVVAPVIERVYGATLRHVDGRTSIPVDRPHGAVPGRGGLRVSFAARLGDGLSGVAEKMRLYPYTCLEQRVSQSIALSDKEMWAQTMGVLPTYLDEVGHLKYFVSESQGHSLLTAYVLGIAAAKGWEIPAAGRTRMITALRQSIAGQASGPESPTATQVAKLIGLEALTRAGEDVTELAEDLVIDPTVLATSELLNWYAVLYRTPQLPDRDTRLERARSTLRSRLVLSGTELGFTTEAVDDEWWLMSSVDVNSLRLLDMLLETGDWNDDIPRIAQGALARQERGAWDLTVANAWGMIALPRFSNRFEKERVSGETRVSLGDTLVRSRWEAKGNPEPITVPWPEGAGELTVEQRGGGKPWATVQSRAVVPLKDSLSRGYTLQKSLEPVIQRTPGRWSNGDIVRVKLAVEAIADRNWVVIDDPIPPGAVVIGGQSLSQSLVADSVSDEKGSGRPIYPTFEERTAEAYRAYVSSLDKGSWRLEYTIRLNTAGTFVLPEARVEAMYSPDMFGALPNPPFVIEP
jgi:uncharacterized protein YfaS (alpha-2-macroglobulin family)